MRCLPQAHPAQALDTAWAHWAETHLPIDRLVLAGGPAVHGVPTRIRILGTWTQPIPFKGMDDAREGLAQGAPWAIFELEKLLRMAVAQSPFAFEFLASHAILHQSLPLDTHFILAHTVTRQLVRNLQHEAQWELAGGRLHEAGCLCATAAALCHGIATLHAPTAFKTLDQPMPQTDAEWHQAIAHTQASDLDALPESPQTDIIMDWLSQRRQELQ